MSESEFFDWLRIQKGLLLNEQQRLAIAAPQGAALILATPGSGKTTVMVARIAYLNLCKQISPALVLPLTFSRAGARDMRRRYEVLFGAQDAPHFGTLHAFCGQVLRAYGAKYRRDVFELLVDSSRVLRHLLMEMGVRYVSEDLLQGVTSAVGYAKNRMLTGEEIAAMEVEDCDFPALFSQYEQYKREKRLMDYDDMLLYALAALRRNPALVQDFRAQYPHLMVDEAQDTSPVQHALVRLLAGTEPSLFMVGDEDQCIYGFRGAQPNALLCFEDDYPGAHVYSMETNYRSGARIVDMAARFISQNSFRRQKTMQAGFEKSATVEQVSLADWREQAAYVIGRVEKLPQEHTLGILYRNNDSAPPLVSMLMAQSIPFALDKSQLRLLTHHTLRNLRSLYALSCDSSDQTAFFDVQKRIMTPLSPRLLHHIRRNGQCNPFVEIYNLGNLSEREKRTLEGKANAIMGYKKMPPYEALLDMTSRFHIGTSGAAAQKVDALLSMARNMHTMEELFAHLQEIEDFMRTQNQLPVRIFLTTIHGAKGLEYDEVILLDVMQDILPASSARNTLQERERYEEEVRLFYVAITRARTHVALPTASKSHGRTALPSPFLATLFAPLMTLARTPPMSKPAKPASPVSRALEMPPVCYAQWENSLIVHKIFGKGKVVRMQAEKELVYVQFGAQERVIHLPTCLALDMIKKLDSGEV